MESEITASQLAALSKKLYNVKQLKESHQKLTQIAENVIHNEYPFSLELKVKVTIPSIDEESSKQKTAEDLLNMLTDKEGEEDFMSRLNNIKKDKPEVIKEIAVNLQNISDKTFFAVLERLVKDLNVEIKNTSKTIKL
jgi:hypothetical protein